MLQWTCAIIVFMLFFTIFVRMKREISDAMTIFEAPSDLKDVPIPFHRDAVKETDSSILIR